MIKLIGSRPSGIRITGSAFKPDQFTYIVVAEAGQTISPKITFTGTNPARIDWGDESASESISSGIELIHSYTTAGTYRVTVMMAEEFDRVSEIDVTGDPVTGLMWSTLLMDFESPLRFIDLWAVGFGVVGKLKIAR